MSVFQIIFPVFAAIALGFVLGRTGFLSREGFSEINRLTYWVGLPAFLFYSIATAEYAGGRATLLTTVMCIATLGGLLLAWIVVRTLRLPEKSHGTLMQGAFRGNIAYVGFPILAQALTLSFPAEEKTLHALALLTMAPTIIVYNVLAVFVLLPRGSPSETRHPWREAAAQILQNPLFLSSVAGAFAAWVKLPQPQWFSASIGVVGQMALPLALLCIGGTLAATSIRGNRTAATAAAIIKIVAVPCIGWAASRAFGLSAAEQLIIAVFLACPTAAASFTLASKLGGDEALAATTVVIGTALSFFSLTAALAIFG